MSKAEARYHITPNGPRLCYASERACRYRGVDSHFTNRYEATEHYREVSSNLIPTLDPKRAKTLVINRERADRVVASENWGSAVADLIDEHVEATSVVPEKIPLTLQWRESSPDGKTEKDRLVFLDTHTRYDEALGKFTNIYRVASWSAGDVEANRIMELVMNSGASEKNLLWSRVPNKIKWEAGFGAMETLADARAQKDRRVFEAASRKALADETDSLDVLAKANIVDRESLERLFTAPEHLAYEQLMDEKAGSPTDPFESRAEKYRRVMRRRTNNVIDVIETLESSTMGPYRAYERGMGFYSIDAERRAYVEENLSNTRLRGRQLHQLGLESNNWITGTWAGDRDSAGNFGLRGNAVYSRVVNSDDRAIPYKSPMTFWTSNTPDGARWELGMNTHSDKEGASRVSFFETSSPTIAEEAARPSSAIEGFVAMKSAMEDRYGDFETWKPELQNEMRILADIAEGYSAMEGPAARARERYDSLVKAAPQEEAKAQHNAHFGGLAQLFG